MDKVNLLEKTLTIQEMLKWELHWIICKLDRTDNNDISTIKQAKCTLNQRLHYLAIMLQNDISGYELHDQLEKTDKYKDYIHALNTTASKILQQRNKELLTQTQKLEKELSNILKYRT